MWARVEKKTILIAGIILCASSYFCSVRVINGNDVSFATVLLLYKESLKQLTYENLVGREFEDWYCFLMPICISISTIPSICDELKSGYYKFMKLRSGDRLFIIQMLITHLISSVFVFALSALLFRMSVYAILFENGSNILYFQIKDFFYNLIYAIMFSGVSIAIAVLTTDVYLSLTIPFVINYFIRYNDLSMMVMAILTILLYMMTAEILKKRWLKC